MCAHGFQPASSRDYKEKTKWLPIRLYKSQKRASEVQKKTRKYKTREKVAAEEIAIAEEGPVVQENFELKH